LFRNTKITNQTLLLFSLDHPDIANAMDNLASTCTDLRRYNEALQLHVDTLNFRKRILPNEHSDIAKSMGNMASTCCNLGLYEQAMEIEEEVINLTHSS